MSKTNHKTQQAGTLAASSQDDSLKPDPAGGASTKKPKQKDGYRETVESIVVAFVLAFLFRAFEAEAFVIPTGSMAPTLYGRHKDIDCEKCGFHFAVGASDEVDNNGYLDSRNRVETALCPNCRYENPAFDLPPFKGDRILVNKFPYEIGDPDRWDVAVFKYPEEPKTNYIKRIVGLPHETILIRQGDLYRIEPSGERKILRKADPDKQKRLQLIVYDHDHPASELHAHGWPEHWAAVTRTDGIDDAVDQHDASPSTVAGWMPDTSGWQNDDATGSFQLKLDGSKDGVFRWLRYRHIAATPRDWEDVEAGRPLREPEPELVSDFCAYNAFTGGHDGQLYRDYYWVGDLTLSGTVNVAAVGDNAELLFELNEGVHAYRCSINLSTGEATLRRKVAENRDDEWQDLAAAKTELREASEHDFRFANVDDRLCLWIDDDLVEFGAAAEYELFESANTSPQEADLIPVGIAARGASLQVSHLLIQRDIYYRSEHTVRDDDFSHSPMSRSEADSEDSLRGQLTDPHAWFEHYSSHSQTARFELGADEYLVLGDNSPRSKDSRLWSNTRQAERRHAVPRSAFVGKAFYVYWPHARPFLNNSQGFPDNGDSLLRLVPGYRPRMFYHTELDFQHNPPREVATDYPSNRIPFYPDVERMRRIR